METQRFKNKIVLITGSSSGIGRSTALAFGREGAVVIVNCLKSIKAASGVVEEIISFGGKAVLIACDISDESQVSELIKIIVDKFGHIDILINNAGITRQSRCLELSASDFKKILDTNLIGTFSCSKYAAIAMLNNLPDNKNIRGKIVNIASIRGLENCSRTDMVDYSASKAGVISLTKSMAKELAPHGIYVNGLAPAITRTELIKNLSPEAQGKAIEGSLFKRMAEPEEIADTILFLASNAANYITGEILVADAGYNLTKL